MTVRFFDFSTYHGKHPDTGSTNIRVNQLLKYWPEAGKYKYGELSDVLIFQKVYLTPDYQFPAHYPGIKILDIADPDWLEGALIKQTVDAMDAVTCPTEALQTFLQQLTDKPVAVIPDRFDLEVIPKPKTHHGDATAVVWFGYRHNAVTLKPAMSLIHELGLRLIVIADDDPFAWQWLPGPTGDEFRRDKYNYIQYSENTIYQDLQQADFAIMPQGSRPVDHFKSNNKTVKTILAGLPVAKDADELRGFMAEAERKVFMDGHYEDTRRQYDVRESVADYKKLIAQLIERHEEDTQV